MALIILAGLFCLKNGVKILLLLFVKCHGGTVNTYTVTLNSGHLEVSMS